MANKMQTKSKPTSKGTKKITFHGGSPDAVKRNKPRGKGKMMKMK